MFEALKLVLILWDLQHQKDLYNVDNNLKFYRYDKIHLSVLLELLKLQSFQSEQVLFMDFSPISCILHLEWLTLTGLTFWRQNYFFNFSTPCIQNVNNTGTKYVRIMKQTAFWREKNGEYIPCLKYSVPILVE